VLGEHEKKRRDRDDHYDDDPRAEGRDFHHHGVEAWLAMDTHPPYYRIVESLSAARANVARQ